MLKKFLFAAIALFSMSWLLAAVNINTASAQELEALHGIGKAKAAAIVQYRTDHGAFKTKEEIKQVKGIGEKIYANIENEISVGAGTAEPAVKTEKKSVTRASKVQEQQPNEAKKTK